MERTGFVINKGQLQAHGSVAQKLQAAGMNVNALRTWIGEDDQSYMNINGEAIPINNASTLRKDEWKVYDKAVIEAARLRLSGVADLNARGLAYNIPNGMGTTVLEYEDLSDITPANMDMDGVTRGEKDRPVWSINYLPLPIIHKDFSINARVLAASRTTGRPLDTTMAELAGKVVAEKAETILFQGASAYSFGGGIIRGYQDFPSRNTVTLAQNWDASGATGASIIADVLAMKQASINDRHYGPWVLYVPTAYETVLDGDYDTTTPGTTIRERILKISGIQAVKVSDYMTANNVLLVQMDSQTVRMVNGLQVTVVEWQTEGNMVHHFKVMAIMVPQIRADQNSRCGIVHLAA